MNKKGNNFNTGLVFNFRWKNNLTKTQFCKECKISFNSFKKFENNDLTLRISSVFKMAKYMKVHISELFC